MGTPAQRVMRIRFAAGRRQLEELRGAIHDEQLSHILGVRRPALDLDSQHPSTWKAIAYLHALVFRGRQRIHLVDILTSFEYCPAIRPKTPQDARSCGVEIVVGQEQFCDGEGI